MHTMMLVIVRSRNEKDKMEPWKLTRCRYAAPPRLQIVNIEMVSFNIIKIDVITTLNKF